jgi:two-component system, sensor histidine kinase ChiS
MKIKYKLILLFIIITLLALLPVSLFQLQRQETERMSALEHQGEIFSQFLSHSVVNIILANGADINSCRIDAGEMISALKDLTGDGLIFAEAILISSRKDYNGIILASFDAAKGSKIMPWDRVNAVDAARMKNQKKFIEINLPGKAGTFYEFTAVGSLPGKPPMCISRLLYSKELVIAPVNEMRRLTYLIIVLAIIFVGLLGYIFSRFISKPIVRLTENTMRFEAGDLDFIVPVESRDEIGHLSSTFNNMLGLINSKIAELEQSNQKLRDLDALKDEFLANISHELKTPLYGIVGIAESLIRGASGKLNEDTNQNLRLIIASGKTLGSLVNDILDFSKMKHYDIKLNLQQVDMHDVAQFVLSITNPLIGKKELVIENKILPGSALVRGDESRLQQILMNLISNAVKFTTRGRITISARHHETDDFIVTTVTDTGIGIPNEKHDEIFEPFRQVDGTITRAYSGTGLGLAITKKLIELHGGKIWFESQAGSGSSFSFSIKPGNINQITFPSEENIENRNQIRTLTNETFHSLKGSWENTSFSKNLDTKSRAKILVVDDEPINLLIVINYLKMEGYDIVTAENGEQVGDIFSKKEIPDLVLLDVMLPRISGYDVCKKIREQYSSLELPVIMLTVRQSTQDIIAGFSAGANDYLIKPVNGEELLARVRNLISMKNSVKLQSELTIINNELEIAMELQKDILPAKLPVIDGLSFGVRFLPSSHISGDFYDYHLIDNENIGVIIADVAGHGIPAAMVASMMQIAYSFSKTKKTEPSDILSEINAILCAYPHGIFLTACCIHINVSTRTMRFSNAGHPTILVYRRAENKILICSVFGRPIGMFPEDSFSSEEISLVPGDRIIMYTDGVVEAWNPYREEYGIERFKTLISDNSHLKADEFAELTAEMIRTWTQVNAERGLSDDVSLIVIDFMN